jgi:extracellular elastinolytic metalloproteinase
MRASPDKKRSTVRYFLFFCLLHLNNLDAGIGEVWANMLHNVYAALVEELGFSDTAHTNPDGPEGNIVFMHLMIDALALQPCNPTLYVHSDEVFTVVN